MKCPKVVKLGRFSKVPFLGLEDTHSPFCDAVSHWKFPFSRSGWKPGEVHPLPCTGLDPSATVCSFPTEVGRSKKPYKKLFGSTTCRRGGIDAFCWSRESTEALNDNVSLNEAAHLSPAPRSKLFDDGVSTSTSSGHILLRYSLVKNGGSLVFTDLRGGTLLGSLGWVVREGFLIHSHILVNVFGYRERV